MKLFYIYGPPAVGKLTVAEKLSSITNIPLFHNHHSRNIVKDIYGVNLMENYELVDKIRVDVLSYCARKDTDLIFTYVYGGSSDDKKVEMFSKTIEDNGGEVMFIELTASQKDLIERVNSDSRKRLQKLIDPVVQADITKDLNIYSIPYVNALKINTSEMSPEESANFIANAYKLRK